MRVKFTPDSEEFALFKDFYKIVQDYYIPEQDDTYWQNLINDTNAFIEKYSEHILARKLASAYLSRQEEIMEQLTSDSAQK